MITATTGTLTYDFFVNPLDMGTAWTAAPDTVHLFEGRDRAKVGLGWTATRVDPA